MESDAPTSPTPAIAEPAQGSPARVKGRRPRYQPIVAKPPSAVTRCIHWWFALTVIAVVNISVGVPATQPLNLWLTTGPVYVLCATVVAPHRYTHGVSLQRKR